MVLWQQHLLAIEFRIVTFRKDKPELSKLLWTKTIMEQMMMLFIINIIYVQSWEKSLGQCFGWLQLLEMLKLLNSNVKICPFMVTHPLQIIAYFFYAFISLIPFILSSVWSLLPLTELHTVMLWILNEWGVLTHSLCRWQVKESCV